ncbi:HsdM family class I SAM-dependent methyltransferase [Aquisphaera insulae]|uniref:class I SAM-dependent DNA methyltransferase n=1 Tax=Aquisphaera insulae TaxID=2712864 RepID=UPI0013ECCA18|nr:class I SAM-dependent DNA methyltransferase [Aquisphaera insulae]
MITGPLRNQIDRLWTEFWTGGITNPLTVIEQISFLMFARLLDIAEARAEKKAARTGKFPMGAFSRDEQHLRWSRFKNLPAEEMIRVVRDGVFPHFRTLHGGGSTFAEYMKDAQLLIVKPSLLVSAVNMIDALPLAEGDTKGDLYEYLLSKLTTAGINGQFRTPRHIIRLMVDLVEPKPSEVVGDPACGTAGFLVGVMEHLLEKYTSPGGVIVHEDGQKTYTGDLLEPYRKHIQRGLFHGYDFDTTMLRIAAMNLMLHGVESPDIHYQDTLSNSFPERFPKLAVGGFDVILANPPFKGSLDESDVHSSLTGKVKTKKTELLFVALILRMLKLGGRAACIVPDGVLFGSSNAHRDLRKMLVEENQLEGVISMPSGVFKPYAGVSTAILIFVKGGKTDRVWFYKMESDGFSLDDKRDRIGDGLGDLPDIRKQWFAREKTKKNDRKAKNFFVPLKEIEANKFDLSIGRYRESDYEEAQYDPPREILQRLRALDDEVRRDMNELESLLK